MWPFKKKIEEVKSEIQLRTRKMKLVFTDTEFNSGKTYIEYTFENGQKILSAVYGHVTQGWSRGRDDEFSANNNINELMLYRNFYEAYAQDVEILTSLSRAKIQIADISRDRVTVVDDPYNIMESMTGVISRAVIRHTTPSLVKHSTAKVVPIEGSNEKTT